MRGGPEAVRLLIRLGADVNARDVFGGYTPLHLAAAHCNRQIVQDTCAVLLAAGAGVDARNGYGTTPLFSAAFRGAGELVDFLVAHGADVNVRSNGGGTVLLSVVRIGMFCDMAERLLGHGADVDAQDGEGRTALMYATLHARPRLMDILIGGGADVGLQDARGRPALMYAAGTAPKASEIGMLGREASTTPEGGNAPNWDVGKKAARLAKAYQTRAETVRHLLARGVSPEQRDEARRTALDVALENARETAGDNAEVVAALSA